MRIEKQKGFTMAEANERLPELVNRAAHGKERIRLKGRNRTAAALVPMEDLEILEKIENMIDLEDARASLLEYRRKCGTPLSETIRGLEF